VSVTPKKTEFKTVETVLKTKGLDGKMTSINHTCAEMDRQVYNYLLYLKIPELFGVSKAVLENVIFCH
jgi:DNA repair protein RAD50